MKKKLISLISLFLFLGTISMTSLVNADINSNEVTLINPKNKTVTTNNLVLISGKGAKGTNIKIETYLANLLSNQCVDLNNPPKGGYVLVVSEDIKIGASGNFARELPLVNGLNRIEVETVDSNDPQIRYVYVTDINKARSELSRVGDIKFIGSLKSLIK